MIKKFDLSNGALVPSENENNAVSIFINPTPEEKKLLMSDFNIDEHTISSALDPDEISRIEIFNDEVSVIWKRPLNYSGQDNFFFDVSSVGLFVAKNRLAIVVDEDISILASVKKTMKLDSVYDIVQYYLHETIQHYLVHLKVIKMISRELQKKINTSMENKHLIQMFNLSESLVHYTNAINSNGSVLGRWRGYFDKLNMPNQVDFIDVLIIENNQCFKQADIYSTVFSGLMDARGTLVNNNMNILLKKLTIINIIFMPLNLLAGIGGMSEYTMMTIGVDWRISYALFILGMVFIAWLTYKVLNKLETKG